MVNRGRRRETAREFKVGDRVTIRDTPERFELNDLFGEIVVVKNRVDYDTIYSLKLLLQERKPSAEGTRVARRGLSSNFLKLKSSTSVSFSNIDQYMGDTTKGEQETLTEVEVNQSEFVESNHSENRSGMHREENT